ncbi:hypothetical protein GQX73_g10563 [Xylaria multiplex]|uniref:NACHT-NTPase and P-loop NTPases N-terminal domain-containing protein n=1 Tax=Xylaria multiplex TaxID=323545 RepID=A0A7C8MKP2_9PEZI|nr:hypothetical protein GQX73_g10563 [Xylaria multiplex]
MASYSIANVRKIVEDARTKYQEVQDVESLGAIFHMSGKALDPVVEVLKRLSPVDGDTLPIESDGSLEACGEKAQLCLKVFGAVAQKMSYKDAAQNKEEKVECLVIGMMSSLKDLIVREGYAEESTERDAKQLQAEIEKLKKAESSVPKGQQPQPCFTARDTAHQSNYVGDGPQYNNHGSGNQFAGNTFSGVVDFRRPSS